MDEFIKGLLKGIIPPAIPWGLITACAIHRVADFLNIKGLEWIFFASTGAIFVASAVLFGLLGLFYALDYDAFQKWTRNTTITLTITAFVIIGVNLLLWR